MHPQEFMCWKIGPQCVELKGASNTRRGSSWDAKVLPREGVNAGQAGKFPPE